MNDQAEKRRDARLRKRMLDTLHRARSGPAGGLSARAIFDILDGSAAADQMFESEDHVAALVADLVAAGYATRRDTRTHKRQRAGIDCLFVAITASGSRMALEEMPPDPLIDDDRIIGGGV